MYCELFTKVVFETNHYMLIQVANVLKVHQGCYSVLTVPILVRNAVHISSSCNSKISQVQSNIVTLHMTNAILCAGVDAFGHQEGCAEARVAVRQGVALLVAAWALALLHARLLELGVVALEGAEVALYNCFVCGLVQDGWLNVDGGQLGLLAHHLEPVGWCLGCSGVDNILEL